MFCMMQDILEVVGEGQRKEEGREEKGRRAIWII
jgi:hypothetical protein